MGVGVKVAGVGLSVKVAMLGVGHEVGRGVGITAGVGGAVGSMVGEGVGFVVFGVKCNGAHPIPVHLKFFPQYESVQHGAASGKDQIDQHDERAGLPAACCFLTKPL